MIGHDGGDAERRRSPASCVLGGYLGAALSHPVGHIGGRLSRPRACASGLTKRAVACIANVLRWEVDLTHPSQPRTAGCVGTGLSSGSRHNRAVLAIGGRNTALMVLMALFLSACSDGRPRESLPDAVLVSRQDAIATVREVERGHRFDRVASKLVTARAYASAVDPSDDLAISTEGPYSWYWVVFVTGDFFDERGKRYKAAVHLVDAFSGEHLITEPQQDAEAPRVFDDLRDEARAER